MLLENGAQVNAQDNNGATPLYYAAYNDASAIAQVLLANGAQVNAQDNNGATPLSVAMEKNAFETAAVLLLYVGRE